MWRILLYLFSVGCVVAQPPLIYNRKVLNAASYVPQSVPGGAIARGSTFSIFGARLGPATPAQVSQFPLTTTLANVSITVTQGTTVVNAIPTYVRDSQINAIMPSNAPLGAVSIRVTYNNFKSNPMTAVISASAFGIFAARGIGFGPGILQNFVSQSVQPINSPTIAAKPGQVMTLWGTGLGAVASDVVAPVPGSLPTAVEVFVGGVSAPIAYSGRTPCCAGIDQIVFTVPANAPLGCWVPVAIRTGGSTVSNMVTMAITPDGSSCFDSFPAPPLVKAGTHGAVLAMRTQTRQDTGTKIPIDVNGDYLASYAVQVPDSPFPFQPLLSAPPAGTCTSYSVKGDLLQGNTLADFVAGTRTVLSSSISVSGPKGLKTIPGALAPLFSFLGASVSNLIPNTLYLDPGTYQINGTGTSSYGPFSATVNSPAPLTWTNRDQLGIVDRTKPLVITWSGGSPGAQDVYIAGFGVDLPTNTTTVFGCTAPDGATSFTVPPLAMANLPPSRPNPLQSKSIIYVASYPDAGFANLSISGVTNAYATFSAVSGKTVTFQ
jgi:uncharacterized protein (TIGR03437 family)